MDNAGYHTCDTSSVWDHNLCSMCPETYDRWYVTESKLIEQAKENGCITKATLLDTWFKAGQRDGKSAEARYPSKYAIYEYYVDGKRYTIVFHSKIPSGQPLYISGSKNPVL